MAQKKSSRRIGSFVSSSRLFKNLSSSSLSKKLNASCSAMPNSKLSSQLAGEDFVNVSKSWVSWLSWYKV